MVNIVNTSFNEGAYRETNLQLAKENNELKQEVSELRLQLSRKDLQLLELAHKTYELGLVASKYKRIASIVFDKRTSINLPSDNGSVPLPLPQPIDNSEPNVASVDYIAVSPDHSELDNLTSESGSESNESTLSAHSTGFKLARISEKSEEPSSNHQSYSDSLEPPEVTSMPPLSVHPEKPPQTPSIFNCLDTLRQNESVEATQPEQDKSAAKSICINEVSNTLRNTNFNSVSPIQPIVYNIKNKDMFQSTPVQKKSKSRHNQENIGTILAENVPEDKPQSKKRQQEVKDVANHNPPSRYNLRKRTRVAA